MPCVIYHGSPKRIASPFLPRTSRWIPFLLETSGCNETSCSSSFLQRRFLAVSHGKGCWKGEKIMSYPRSNIIPPKAPGSETGMTRILVWKEIWVQTLTVSTLVPKSKLLGKPIPKKWTPEAGCNLNPRWDWLSSSSPSGFQGVNMFKA